MSIYILYGIFLQSKLDIYEIVFLSHYIYILHLCNLIYVFLLFSHIENFMPNNIFTPSRRISGSYKVPRSLLFFYFASAVILEGNAAL